MILPVWALVDKHCLLYLRVACRLAGTPWFNPGALHGATSTHRADSGRRPLSGLDDSVRVVHNPLSSTTPSRPSRLHNSLAVPFLLPSLVLDNEPLSAPAPAPTLASTVLPADPVLTPWCHNPAFGTAISAQRAPVVSTADSGGVAYSRAPLGGSAAAAASAAQYLPSASEAEGGSCPSEALAPWTRNPALDSPRDPATRHRRSRVVAAGRQGNAGDAATRRWVCAYVCVYFGRSHRRLDSCGWLLSRTHISCPLCIVHGSTKGFASYGGFTHVGFPLHMSVSPPTLYPSSLQLPLSPLSLSLPLPSRRSPVPASAVVLCRA
jgi:hypothetical protein